LVSEADQEWLDTKIRLLNDKLTSKYASHRMNIHRQVVDLRNALITVKDYADKIKVHTNIDITPHLITFLER